VMSSVLISADAEIASINSSSTEIAFRIFNLLV
jgi:hypothetical protein